MSTATPYGPEISEGLLHCDSDHWFPIVRGVPRMLPDALETHWAALTAASAGSARALPSSAMPRRDLRARSRRAVERRTRERFSLEWSYLGERDRVWGVELDDRVRQFFLEPIRIPTEQLEGKTLLDAGCGNGTQSVAYTEHGLEVVALDLSLGVEFGQGFRQLRPRARPDRVHFVQADLQSPPLAPASFDIIHSAGVLHHTPDTKEAFRRIRPLLRPSGSFYVYLYKYERGHTPLLNTIRWATTRIPSRGSARLAVLLAPAAQAFCSIMTRLGVRRYPHFGRREMAHALMDVFAAPYAHYHSFAEVAEWYRAEGLADVWLCHEELRGFGACGRAEAGSADSAAAGLAP